MPQHLWHVISTDTASLRYCDVCLAKQFGDGKTWAPDVSAICPGDDEDGPSTGQRIRPRPLAPSDKVLEAA